jgi:hypothetical protein
LTEAEVDMLRDLCEEATPGPWMYTRRNHDPTVQAMNVGPNILGMTVCSFRYTAPEEDGEFIAAARVAIPRLLAERVEIEAEARLADELRKDAVLRCELAISMQQRAEAELVLERAGRSSLTQELTAVEFALNSDGVGHNNYAKAVKAVKASRDKLAGEKCELEEKLRKMTALLTVAVVYLADHSDSILSEYARRDVEEFVRVAREDLSLPKEGS